jgi:exodeoxyribonuclease V alpha subunit
MMQALQTRDIDVVFADFICSRAGQQHSELLHKAALLTSAAVGSGNICLDLAEAFGATDFEKVTAELKKTTVVGAPGEYLPLILDTGGRLYLYRYWKYETELAQLVQTMAVDTPKLDMDLLQNGLERLFGPPGTEPDWQSIAAAAAVRSRFCVVSGGPGTGKTSTVVKIMALILEQAKGRPMRVALAAPTGKAAARLKDSLAGAGKRLEALTNVAGMLPDDVSTIHRMLGVVSGSSRFQYNKDNRLPYEAVVIDEASMVPLPLMAKVVSALAPGARLILLGDRDQLASVEAGAVLGDMCDTGHAHGFTAAFKTFMSSIARAFLPDDSGEKRYVPLTDSVVILRKNYRFSSNSGIGAVSRAINEGNAEAALESFRSEKFSDVLLSETPLEDTFQKALEQVVIAGYGDYLAYTEPGAVLEHFDRFRVLCAMRQGSYGVEGVNRSVERILAHKGLIKPHQQWYHGRPVMVSVNDYTVKLFNGDIGIALADSESVTGLSVYFPSTGGAPRKVSSHKIPAHETVFAMTVHKSQGSEFDRVLVIMPPFDNRILTRELLYTGLTRARSCAELWCSERMFVATVERKIERRSGLRQALWENDAGVSM